MADDGDAQHVHSEYDEAKLDEFTVEIQKVTNFVNNTKEKEEKQLNGMDSMESPSIDSNEESVASYSAVSDDVSYIHGAQYSEPKARFHSDSAIPDIVAIHDLLTMRHQTLFFIAESDDESKHNDLVLNDEELSEERKKNDANQYISNDEEQKQQNQNIPKKKKNKKRISKLKRSLSERGLIFAIRFDYILFHRFCARIKCFYYTFKVKAMFISIGPRLFVNSYTISSIFLLYRLYFIWKIKAVQNPDVIGHAHLECIIGSYSFKFLDFSM